MKNLASTCPYNYIGCSETLPKNIGLLLTKDDGKIISTWFKDNSRYFHAIVVLDGSTKSNFTSFFFSRCNSVFYFHESSFPSLKAFSDGELRRLGHELITNIFGYGVWITMAHSDEFYVHSPLKVIERAKIEKADYVRWSALHVLPHPSEFKHFLAHPDAPVTEIFRHYYHFGPVKGAFLESRMFLNKPDLLWKVDQGSILPKNIEKELSLHPAYMHYKVHELSLDSYTVDGVHKNHWNKVVDEVYVNPNAKRGVGIRWKVEKVSDFFVDHFPNSKKYKYVSVSNNGVIEKYLDIGDDFKDAFPCS